MFHQSGAITEIPTLTSSLWTQYKAPSGWMRGIQLGGESLGERINIHKLNTPSVNLPHKSRDARGAKKFLALSFGSYFTAFLISVYF